MELSKALLYFVKYPTPGKVKTRLAKSMGFEQAAKAYRELAEENLRLLSLYRNESLSIIVMYDPPDAEEKMRLWLPGPFIYQPQVGAGLGERLIDAFEFAWGQGAKQVIAMGSDTLGFELGHLNQAFKALNGKDLVLGPARDGGYYLIGSSRSMPEVFKDIPWSTSSVLERTIDRVKQKDYSFSMLPTLEDLDDASNLIKKGERYAK